MKIKLTILVTTLLLITAYTGFSSTDAAVNKNNGNKSVNVAKQTTVKSTSVGQLNAANQTNLVGVDQNSGNNKANHNTKGTVTVGPTGKSNAAVVVANSANQNEASIENCNCTDPATAKNVNNGSKSVNYANVKDISTISVVQNNVAVQTNIIGVAQNTGNNSSNSNTGGNVENTSGDTTTKINVENIANTNSVVIK